MNARNGKECKKVNCMNYESYKKWDVFNSNTLKICMNCKNAFKSQYVNKESKK